VGGVRNDQADPPTDRPNDGPTVQPTDPPTDRPNGQPTERWRPSAWLCDLDGVIWRGSTAIPGSPETITALRAAGERVVFISNNSSTAVGDYLAKLSAIGIPTDPNDLVTSAQAAAGLVGVGARAMVLGGPGITEALTARGVETVDAGTDKPGQVDVVVVGLDRTINYQRLSAAVTAVLGGAMLIGTNEDPTFPTADGLRPGGGAILAAVMYATGASPVIAGKPHTPIAALTKDRLGTLDVSKAVMVGDQPRTDGLFAQALGAQFALVLSGVTTSSDGVVPKPAYIAADLRELVDRRGDGASTT
jgi:HAD superfamily hydrolase (TIGR01450 family)